ncbi:hypothetical protein M427DRAFT_141705 [Gonapodya prolifera JEL478]|uniref:Pre-mRNA-splicing factor CWC24 n=1 Tax=Gonapodya prolifera (strain JEL478) TaxID=1344416 RepID=A0A139AZE8_GONPJ|nr:hypothetical protein M427DRAFT_141705 [Gonapodya prolifera JEL478]|eukprot:KXS22080.1 hypothetical protein M427DRAFT_141705 [Gonapodya prolifera JEL478]
MEETSQSPSPVVAFKSGKSRASKNIKKRERSPSPDQSTSTKPSTDTSGPVRKATRSDNAQSLLSSSSSSVRAASRATSTADPDGPLRVSFAGSGSAATAVGDSATRTLELDDNKDRMGNTSMQKGLRAGPQRGVTNVRISSRFDYQPDICKDYKETGYCGYGDSCKFLHDRGDYKAGWIIEREWEEKQRKKEKQEEDAEKWIIRDGNDEEEEEQPDDDVPFACLICRKEFVDPVVTKCNHYFCERCALSNHSKSPKCFACGASTGGVFHMVGKDVRAKMKEAAQRMKEREQEIDSQMKEMGDDGVDADGGNDDGGEGNENGE